MAGRSRPDHIRIGRIVGAHGIQGGFKIEPLTDFLERFEPGETIYVDQRALKIRRLTYHKSQLRIETQEVTDRNEAETLQWKDITVPAEKLPDRGEDEFYTRDLIGLAAIDESGESLGQVSDVKPSPAHDLLIIGGAMVPMVKEFVKAVDLQARTITIRPIPGLFEE